MDDVLKDGADENLDELEQEALGEPTNDDVVDDDGSGDWGPKKTTRRLGKPNAAFIPMSKAYKFTALYLTPEQIKQAALWKKPPLWPKFVPWSAPIVKACQMWLNPNIGAAMEISDRTEGKVKQMLEVENRGVVALPIVQVSSAEEWRAMFSQGAARKELPPVSVTVEPSPAKATYETSRKPRGRPRKYPEKD